MKKVKVPFAVRIDAKTKIWYLHRPGLANRILEIFKDLQLDVEEIPVKKETLLSSEIETLEGVWP